MQLKQLWDFMQVDIAADNFETEMRKSENRQKLIKNRNFLLEQQANMKKIESDISVMQDRLEAVHDEAVRLEGLLSAALTDIEENPPSDSEEALRRIDSAQKLTDSLSRYEQELNKMRKDADTRDRQQKDIRVRAAKAKQEYDITKENYDKEFKADTAKLASMRESIEKEASKLDQKLYERYKLIKQHSTPPMAKMIDGQCCGCFMTLPSATIRKLSEEEDMVVCDNCGRILYCENQ